MGQLLVYPHPQKLRLHRAMPLRLAPGMPIMATPPASAEIPHLCRWLQADYSLEVAPVPWDEQGDAIRVGLLQDAQVQSVLRRLGLRPDGREAVAEGYMLATSAGGVIVAGHDAAGIFYGLQALRQLITHADGTIVVSAAEIHDWPHKPVRGAHLYMPARSQLPFFRRFLEFMASLRLNTLFLEVGGGMRYDRHPEINRGWADFTARIKALPGGVVEAETGFPFPKNSTHYELGGGSCLEKDEVEGMLAYARALHIEVLPEVQSLGHCYYLCCAHPEIAENAADPFPDTYCPSNPASYALLFDVLEEVIEVFQPRLVHIGHDEVYALGLCPRCRGQNAADLMADDIVRIHDFLAARNIRTAIWGEKLLNIVTGGQPLGGRERVIGPGTWFKNTEPYVIAETYPAIARVPRDVLILNWYYGVDLQSTAFFAAQRFEQILGNMMFQGPAPFPGWRQVTAPEGVLGGEVSTWCEVSEEAFGHDAIFYNLAYAAQPLWWSHHSEWEADRAREAIAALQPRTRARLSGGDWPSLAPDVDLVCYPLPASSEEVTIPGLPEGRVALAGTPFLLGPAGAAALQVDTAHLTAPAVTIRGQLDSILFLHHCRCRRHYYSTYGDHCLVLPTPEGILGWYVIRYVDGSEERADISFGGNIANCDLRFGEDPASCCYWADPVWQGEDEEGRPVVLYRYEWVNPHPERAIACICLQSAGGEGEVRLAGLTGVRLH